MFPEENPSKVEPNLDLVNIPANRGIIKINSNNGDPWVYRIVVGSLSATVLCCLAGAIALQVNGKATPELLTALGTGSLGAISGLLAPSPVRN